MFEFFEDENTAGSQVEALPREYGIDFDNGQLTGEIVEGSEAVKIWAWLALQSARYRYPIYTWQYGSELESLIGTQWSDEYTESQCKKMIEECLKENPNIEGIKNFECKMSDRDKLTASFTLVTKFGEEEIIANV